LLNPYLRKTGILPAGQPTVKHLF